MTEQYLASLIGMQNTFIGEAPAQQDECQWIVRSHGNSDIHFLKQTVDHPIFSIYLRGKNHGECLERTNRAYNAVKLQGESIDAIIPRRLPAYVGKDDKQRVVYTFQVEYQTGGY